MKLIISDDCWKGDIKTIIDPKYIPRKGEYIEWSYLPMPKVKEVVYDFEREEIRIKISDT